MAIATAARGRVLSLYVLLCALCAALTGVVSLDGAIVLMIPGLRALSRRLGCPTRPVFLGLVAVANASSIAVPQGNPTNLVVMNELGLSPAAFLAHMLGPGCAAALVCAAGVALLERRRLSGSYTVPARERTPLTPRERHALVSLAAAALAAWIAPLLGLAPWWPFAAVVVVALALQRLRPQLSVPWRLAVQLAGLVVVIEAVGLHESIGAAPALTGLTAISVGVGALAALVNNLPASVWATTLLGAGPAAYATSIGLAVGALATPHGSVATLLATDLAGLDAAAFPVRWFAPLAAAAVLASTLLLWTTL